MSDGLDVIILDDDPGICEIIAELIDSFYTWGKVYSFSNADEAIDFCLNRDIGVAEHVGVDHGQGPVEPHRLGVLPLDVHRDAHGLPREARHAAHLHLRPQYKQKLKRILKKTLHLKL